MRMFETFDRDKNSPTTSESSTSCATKPDSVGEPPGVSVSADVAEGSPSSTVPSRPPLGRPVPPASLGASPQLDDTAVNISSPVTTPDKATRQTDLHPVSPVVGGKVKRRDPLDAKFAGGSPKAKDAADPSFLGEFFQNSRLHHISTMGANAKVKHLESERLLFYLMYLFGFRSNVCCSGQGPVWTVCTLVAPSPHIFMAFSSVPLPNTTSCFFISLWSLTYSRELLVFPVIRP